MLKQYHSIIGGFYRFADALTIGCVWILSYWFRFYLPFFEVTKGLPAFSTYAALLPLVMGIWFMVFTSLKVYQSRRLLRRTHEAHQVLRAHGTALLVFIAMTYLFSEYKYSRLVMVYFSILGGVALVTLRMSIRNILRTLRKRGFNLRHLLIVGEGPQVETLIRRLEKFPEAGLRTIGILTEAQSNITSIADKPVIGHYQNLPKILLELRPDMVLVALPREHYRDLDSVLANLKEETVDVRLVPDIHEYVTLGCEVEEFDGFPIVNLNESPLEGWGSIAKRFTDIVLSSIGLLVCGPLMLLIAGLIRLTSKGPVLFRQERMGLDGLPFQMLKFRTMGSDAEKETGAVWAVPNDNRRTFLGRFLRSTSLDELPQLWNVLRGDMSLVGPRPERPVFVHQFRKDIPHYMLRHKVKAGITGWAQVNGWRGNTSLARRIECDIYYIKNWSYFLDLKILFLTFYKGFINKNAY